MAKRPTKPPPENKPFGDDFLEWMDSDQGQTSITAHDLVFDALDNASVDAGDRKIVWGDGTRLSIQQSAERIHAEHPDVPRDQVESHVVGWLENCVPEGYSESQLEELDRLTEEWLQEYTNTSHEARD